MACVKLYFHLTLEPLNLDVLTERCREIKLGYWGGVAE